MAEKFVVLIVDDQKDIRRFLRKIIESKDCIVQEAVNGKEGLEIARLHKPNLIISDVLMPVMDGFQFCRKVKKDDRLKNIPFVFYSATYVDKKDEEYALSLGAEKYIIKPVEPDVLLKLMEHFIEGYEKGTFVAKQTLIGDEKETFKIYSERLVNKLEKKMLDLEKEVLERKQVEEELKKHRENLEEMIEERTKELETANKELEAFSYSISHDLRAPLRAIDGFTRILIEDYASKLDEEGKQLGSTIHENAMKMSRLIDDLLVFSRLGRTSMTPTKINIKSMVNATYHEVTSAEERQRIKFSIADLPRVEGDINLIRQVWMNLIKNAVKFSSKRQQAVISVTSKEEKKKIIYCIKDNGAGFNMKYVDKLFGVFQRLHSEKDYKGTGIGLSLVQRIIQRHDGKVWAEGEVDKGASFYFSLPNKVK